MTDAQAETRPVAVVTGAARGIGGAVASQFAARGWCVKGLDIAEPLSTDSTGYSPYQVDQCDVASETDIKRAFEHVESDFGQIDVLVNAAGVIVVKPTEDVTWREFQRLVDVNLGGQWLACKYALPIMKRRRRGVIVNVASVSAHVGQIDHALYGATKGAIVAFTRALALEVAPFGLRAVSVSPGSVDTEMLQGDVRSEAVRLGRPYDELRREREEEQALHRWAAPSEIAALVWFLASDEAAFMTGTDVLIDGGWTAR
jgi:NAD(P)-dependent dehydrogenase (short-subunit alcohol dehydrogenase family)